MNYRKRILIPMVILAGIAHSCAKLEMVRPPTPPPPETGQVSGILAPEGIGVPLAGATVEAGGVKATVKADNTFEINGIPQGKQNVIIEKRFPSGPVLRAMGISTIFVSNGPVRIRVPVRDATDVDAFCLECHPPLKNVTRRDQKPRDIHVSGIVPKNANKDRSLLDGRGRVTCESCHTAHRQGEYPFFGVDDIRSGPFCNRCHKSG